jgi:hypothetical protein
MNLFLKIILILIFSILIYEMVLSYTRVQRRKQIFKVAQQRSIETKKPLLVIGDPENGSTNFVLGRSYGCGDVCVDLTGCPGCPNGVQEKIESFLVKKKSNSYVIFISCVLEYVNPNQIDLILQELERVSGNDLYVVSVDPLSITALFYPTRWITGESAPNQIILNEYPEKKIEYISI